MIRSFLPLPLWRVLRTVQGQDVELSNFSGSWVSDPGPQPTFQDFYLAHGLLWRMDSLLSISLFFLSSPFLRWFFILFIFLFLILSLLFVLFIHFRIYIMVLRKEEHRHETKCLYLCLLINHGSSSYISSS